MKGFALGRSLVVLLPACLYKHMANTVRQRHAAEFECAAESVVVDEIITAERSGQFSADGCGVRAIYVCSELACLRNSAPEMEQPSGDACSPPCSPGYSCQEGTCVGLCNPPCPEGWMCSPERVCRGPSASTAQESADETSEETNDRETSDERFTPPFPPSS